MGVHINKKKIQISELVDMKSIDAILEEVKYNFIQFYPVTAFYEIRNVYRDFNDLFDGKYPGYKKCNTDYHDKLHTMDTLLAISRLIDGYNIKNRRKLPLKKVRVALIATIFHDSGFIQTLNDSKGTGAKYTLEHIRRSIVFIREYFQKTGMNMQDFTAARNMVSCTGVATEIDEVEFTDDDERTLGRMLGTADLLGQMASRKYLENLTLLYREFREGKVPGYESEFHLLQRTLKFYEDIKRKIKKEFKSIDRYMQAHFKKRYHINEDLYKIAMQNHIDYLKDVLKRTSRNYRSMLRRKQ